MSVPTVEIFSKEVLRERQDKAKQAWITTQVRHVTNEIKRLTSETDYDKHVGGMTFEKYVSRQQSAYRDALYGELKTIFPDSTVYLEMKPIFLRQICCSDKFWDCFGFYSYTMRLSIIWS